MKKHFKKLLPVLLILTLTLVTFVTVEAKTITSDSKTVTVYSKSSKAYNNFLKKSISANEKILTTVPNSKKITNLKSTNTAVVTLKTQKGSGNAKGYTAVFLKIKKAGTATVSYKIGTTTYKTKIIVKKYTNPFSTLKLGGQSITSKFKTNNVYTLRYAKYKNKSLKLNYKAKSGWTIVSADYLLSTSSQKADWVDNNKSFKVTKKNSALVIDAYNAKTKQSEQIMIIFN